MSLIKLKTLLIYIKTNLVSRFIKFFKLLTSILILFVDIKNKKVFFINYKDFNNLIIKKSF